MRDYKAKIIKFIKSFEWASEGIRAAFTGRNMRVHAVGAFFAVFTGLMAGLVWTEWAVISLIIGVVFGMEIVNTAIEEVCDRLRDDLKLSYESTKKARDLAAGAVLVNALVAILVWWFVIGTKLIDLKF